MPEKLKEFNSRTYIFEFRNINLTVFTALMNVLNIKDSNYFFGAWPRNSKARISLKFTVSIWHWQLT